MEPGEIIEEVVRDIEKGEGNSCWIMIIWVIVVILAFILIGES